MTTLSKFWEWSPRQPMMRSKRPTGSSFSSTCQPRHNMLLCLRALGYHPVVFGLVPRLVRQVSDCGAADGSHGCCTPLFRARDAVGGAGTSVLLQSMVYSSKLHPATLCRACLLVIRCDDVLLVLPSAVLLTQPAKRIQTYCICVVAIDSSIQSVSLLIPIT